MTFLAPFILEFRIHNLPGKRQYPENVPPEKTQIQYFPLHILENPYISCCTEIKCQCSFAQAIKVIIIEKRTGSLRVICHCKALRCTHFTFRRQRKIRLYLFVVFPYIHTFIHETHRIITA